MNITAVILEQIDWDRTDKSFQMKADTKYGDLWVAFPPDYDEERSGPLHFLDTEYTNLFNSRLRECRARKLPEHIFSQEGDKYCFTTTWNRIPTERQSLTYYVLYLPEFAIPEVIKITDTHDETREFKKNVFRDDQKKRFAIYLECSSKFGEFNFKIDANFHFDKNEFDRFIYSDEKTVDFYSNVNHWEHLVSTDERIQIKQFFSQNLTVMENHHNDKYEIQQAGAVGPNASAQNNTFNQMNYQVPANIDFDILGEQLSQLRNKLVSTAQSPEHYIAIGEVAQAETASKSKEGNKVVKHLLGAGKWVFDTAKEIGVDVVSELIKKQMQL